MLIIAKFPILPKQEFRFLKFNFFKILAFCKLQFHFILSFSAAYISGNAIVASSSTFTNFAAFPILPHDTASLGCAPERLPSHYAAVVT